MLMLASVTSRLHSPNVHMQAFIEPDLKTAHLKIYNTFNPFSGFMNATYILKSAKRVTKQQIKAVLQVGSWQHQTYVCPVYACFAYTW